jgi:hypothetical protein
METHDRETAKIMKAAAAPATFAIAASNGRRPNQACWCFDSASYPEGKLS